MQRTVLRLLPLAMLFAASAATAQTSQLDLRVLDMNGQELGPVNITITAPDGEVTKETTRKNGRIKIRLAPADEPYKLLLQKEGHPDREVEFTMTKGRDTSFAPQLWDEATMKQQKAVDAFNEAIRIIQSGDATASLPHFEEAVEFDPTIAAAWRLIAAIRHDMGQNEEALEPLNKYLELEPLPLEFAPMAFNIFRAAGDARAEEYKAASVDAGMGAQIAPGVFADGVAAVRAGDDEGAIILFTEAASLDPNLFQAYRNIGTIHFNNQNWEPALEALGRTLELDPGNNEAMRMRFFSYALQGNLEESIAAGKAWIEVNSTAGRQVQHQAEQLFQDEVYGNAKLYDQSLIAWDDNHPRAHFRLGVIYRRSADSGPAREHLTKYLASAPDDEDIKDLARAHYELGILAVNASDAATAREHLTKSLEMAPEGEYADVARAALDQL